MRCTAPPLQPVREHGKSKVLNMKFMILIVFGVSCFQSFVTLFFFAVSFVAVKISTEVKFTVPHNIYSMVVGAFIEKRVDSHSFMH